jgi:hypothetical protein
MPGKPKKREIVSVEDLALSNAYQFVCYIRLGDEGVAD